MLSLCGTLNHMMMFLIFVYLSADHYKLEPLCVQSAIIDDLLALTKCNPAMLDLIDVHLILFEGFHLTELNFKKLMLYSPKGLSVLNTRGFHGDTLVTEVH